jgi:serine/threonine protein kinase
MVGFDLAKLPEQWGQPTPDHLSGPAGVPAFMPPEQFEDIATVDSRADVYALGVMLFNALTGELPYPESDPRELYATLQLTREGAISFSRVKTLAPWLPSELDELCAHAMALDVADRLPTVESLLRQLRLALNQTSLEPPGASPGEHLPTDSHMVDGC